MEHSPGFGMEISEIGMKIFILRVVILKLSTLDWVRLSYKKYEYCPMHNNNCSNNQNYNKILERDWLLPA